MFKMLLKIHYLKNFLLKLSFIKNVAYLFIALIIFVLCTLFYFIFSCSSILNQAAPIGLSMFYKKQIYATKQSTVVYNKEICENDYKKQVVINSTSNNNKFVDFYSKVVSEKREKQLDNLHDQFDLATVLLPRFSQGIFLNNITNSLFLYSAFYQSAENPKLSIIGIAISEVYCPNSTSSNVDKVLQLLCVFDNHHSGELRVKAMVDCLPEGHDFYYTSVLIHCPVPARVQTHQHLKKIKLIQRNLFTHQSEVSKNINVINNEKEQTRLSNSSLQNYDITLCVRPLFDSINVLNLLEFISYYQFNGITNVALYYFDFVNMSMNSPTTARAVHFLKFIAKIPGVKLHPFVLPKTIEQSVHSGAQIATIHDCLMRYPNSVQIHVDIDEFVFIEKRWLTIRQWIDDQLESSKQFVALYIPNLLHCHEFNFGDSTYYEFAYSKCKQFTTFSNLHQCDQYSTKLKNQFYKELNSQTVRKALITPNNVNSQQTPWPHETRSKVIILKPKLIQHMGIHNVWKYNSPDVLSFNFFTTFQQHIARMIGLKNNEKQFYGHKNVNFDEIVLRHYRWCCNIEQPYFFQILHFYSIDDTIVRMNFVNQNIHVSPALKKFHIKSINKTNSKIKQFVLHNFKQFLKTNNTNT